MTFCKTRWTHFMGLLLSALLFVNGALAQELDTVPVVPPKALEEALNYLQENKTHFPNTEYLSIINYAPASSEKRFFIVHLQTGKVWALHVAHGAGSDRNHDGLAEAFSNLPGSNATSLGFYRTGEVYLGKHGPSLRLDGLSLTNSNARDRAIVIHGADYVQEESRIQGRSWGCPAVAQNNREEVIERLKGGSLLYATLEK